MIRIVAAGVKHPDRTTGDFRRYWTETHGPLCARTPGLRKYVQHATLDEAYRDDPAPTYDGVSMLWFDDLDALVPTDPDLIAAWEAVSADDARVFDRSTAWPTDHRKACVVGTERVVLDGTAKRGMIKVIFFSARRPGLTLPEFFQRWAGTHGSLLSALPGVRRYVQTHAVPASYGLTGALALTHDGCTELWFDDYKSWQKAMASRAWSAVVDSGETLFARPAAYAVGREIVVKDWG